MRVDVGGCGDSDRLPACYCCTPDLLIEQAAALGQTETCRVLIECGRLDATFATELIDRRITWYGDAARSLDWPLRDMILAEDWSDTTFCRQYLDAISHRLMCEDKLISLCEIAGDHAF